NRGTQDETCDKTSRQVVEIAVDLLGHIRECCQRQRRVLWPEIPMEAGENGANRHADLFDEIGSKRILIVVHREDWPRPSPLPSGHIRRCSAFSRGLSKP